MPRMPGLRCATPQAFCTFLLPAGFPSCASGVQQTMHSSMARTQQAASASERTVCLQMERCRGARQSGCMSFAALGREEGSGWSRDSTKAASWGRDCSSSIGRIRCRNPLRYCRRSLVLITGLKSSKNSTPCRMQIAQSGRLVWGPVIR